MHETFHIINFGCRATQADGAAIEQTFLEHNFVKALNSDNAAIVVINTCTVTQSADAEARQIIRRIHRENPKAKIVVTGCYAQRDPQVLAKLEGVISVIGNSHKDQLVPLLLKNHFSNKDYGEGSDIAQGSNASIYCSNINDAVELQPTLDLSGAGKTRPILKIQDGCNMRCSYCIVPFVRGNSRSLSEDQVIGQIEKLLKLGYQEIVLSGIHLGAYGRDLQNKSNFTNLLKRILQQTPPPRLRLSSIEPLDLTDDIIDLLASSPNLAKHLHVPLQSGSDRILRLMRRPYLVQTYFQIIEKIHQAITDVAIGADVMVGFPTEKDEDQESTIELLQKLPLTYLHVFPYSERPGTPAQNLKPVVPRQIIQERGKQLREISLVKNLNFRVRFLNKTLSVVTLAKEGEEHKLQGLSTNYLKVDVPSHIGINQLLEVNITALTDDGLIGEPL